MYIGYTFLRSFDTKYIFGFNQDDVEKAFGQYTEECGDLAELPAPAPAVRRSPFESPHVRESPNGSGM